MGSSPIGGVGSRRYMDKVIGTCSVCCGAVTVPDIWHGVTPPIPSCKSCGARKKQPHGPVIEMDPSPLGKALSVVREIRSAWEARKS